jgi:hypothetical protein
VTRPARLEHAGQRTADGEHAAATEVAQQVQRDRRRPFGVPDRVQHAGGRQIGDVVTGASCHRPFLAPAGHPDVDEARVAVAALRRSESQPLHDPGPEALHEHVGLGDECQCATDVVSLLQVQCDRPAASAIQHR